MRWIGIKSFTSFWHWDDLGCKGFVSGCGCYGNGRSGWVRYAFSYTQRGETGLVIYTPEGRSGKYTVMEMNLGLVLSRILGEVYDIVYTWV